MILGGAFMSRTATVRSERIELRTKPELKSIIMRAAQIRNTTLSAYLLDSALQKAQADIQNTENILLNEEDRELFYSLMAAPPPANEALRDLFNKAAE
jgi:uncharacterized protein (DUF1778 family)